ncbi:MAG: glycosyltransferase [Candidatus Sericytochromatia bacterium]
MSNNYQYLLTDLQRAEDRSRPKINPEQKLSLCMIVRNEEAYLADALKSAQEIVDEIIVVDTGSSDRTVEIAREYGAKVFFKEWDDSFASARNESLAHATGDWVLIMDADERIPAQFKDNLRSLLIPTEQPLSYLVYIRNYLRENDESSVLGHYVVRLFRKTPETTFFGVIHEQLYPNWGQVTVPEDSFHLTHLGYGKQDKKSQKIEQRNLPLIQKALEQSRDENPDLYSFYAFYMGTSVENINEIKHWLKESIDSCPRPESAPHIPVAYLDYMRALFYCREFDEGIAIAEKAIATVPSMNAYPDFWDFYGVLLLSNEQPDKAIEVFEKTLELVTQSDTQSLFFATHSSRIGSWGTLLNLGLAHASKGSQEEAQRYFIKAMEEFPSQDKTQILQRIDQIMGSTDMTRAYFEERIRENETQDLYDVQALSNIYLKQEQPFEAVLLQRDLHGPEKAIETALELAQTYVRYQRFDLAEKTYTGILSLVPDSFSARLGKWLVTLHKEGASPDAATLEGFLAECQSLSDWMKMGEFSLHFGMWPLAIEAYQQALRQSPNHYQASLYLALAEQQAGEMEQAEAHLRELIEKEPKRLEAHTQFGNLLLFMGRFADAEVVFQRLTQLMSNVDWYTRYALGLALAGQDRFDEAIAELNRSRQLGRNQPAPYHMLQMIEQARQQAATEPSA